MAEVQRRLDMDMAMALQDGENGLADEDVPSVEELLLEVGRLHETVQSLNGGDQTFSDPLSDDFGRHLRPTLSLTSIGSNDRDSVLSSPLKDDMSDTSSFGLRTPPRARHPAALRHSNTAPRGMRVGALTKENISLLPRPLPRSTPNRPGSTAGSQKSRTSARTDGGAVFSRLYQPDYYKKREAKMQTIRDRRESLQGNASLPRTASHRRNSIESRGSMGSMDSAKTDSAGVSSRLYDPDYVRKRNAKLSRMKEQRDLRDCTFTPDIGSSSRRQSDFGTISRRQSDIGTINRSIRKNT